MRASLRSVMVAVLAVASALLLGAALLAAVHVASPGAAYLRLLQGATGLNPFWSPFPSVSDWILRPGRIGNSLNESAPLILAALGMAVPFACGLLNIGAEGQLLMGGLGATWMALLLGEGHPHLAPAVACGAGFALGALWGAAAGWMKASRGLDEIITTIMLNFVAFWLVSYLVHGPMKDTTGFGYPWSREVPEAARLPRVWASLHVSWGFLVAMAAALLVALLLNRTALGYELRSVGSSPRTARFAGIGIGRSQVVAMATGGGLAGLAGACSILGVQFRLSDSFSPGYGYQAIAILFIARGSPLGILAAGVFFGAFTTGAEAMEQSAAVPKSLVLVIEGFALIFAVLGQTGRINQWFERRRTLAKTRAVSHASDRHPPVR